MSNHSLSRLGLLLVSLLGLFSLSAGSALAAGPPIVTVNAASNLRLNTATGSGTVDKNGAVSATVKIEYGKSKLYGNSITLPNVTTTGAVSVSETLAGLEPAATYHYRISATNSYGTTTSEDVQWEQLLRWKVGGKAVSELSEAPGWVPATTWELTGEGTLGGAAVKITCGRGNTWAGGHLGVDYSFPFAACKFFANGKEISSCKGSSPITVTAGAWLQTTSATSLYLGEECPYGEKVALPTGYGIEPVAEALHPNITLLGHAGNLNFRITSDGWGLTGIYVASTFGIS